MSADNQPARERLTATVPPSTLKSLDAIAASRLGDNRSKAIEWSVRIAETVLDDKRTFGATGPENALTMHVEHQRMEWRGQAEVLAELVELLTGDKSVEEIVRLKLQALNNSAEKAIARGADGHYITNHLKLPRMTQEEMAAMSAPGFVVNTKELSALLRGGVIREVSPENPRGSNSPTGA